MILKGLFSDLEDKMERGYYSSKRMRQKERTLIIKEKRTKGLHIVIT